MATSLNCALHEVGLRLETEGKEFLSFARQYLRPLQARDGIHPTIEVRLEWGRRLPPTDLEPLGRRVWIGDGRLRLSEIRPVPGLELEMEWGQASLQIHAAYRWPTRRARWLARFSWAARARLYVPLLYYLVYFPLGWWMERERGWSLIHAAGLADGEEGVVLTGLPGCGKSTFVWAALTLPGWRVLSDNLLFTDGHLVWACPEPLHVDRQAQELSGGSPEGVRSAGRTFSHHREDFEPEPHRQAEITRPRKLIFLQRGREGRIRRLEESDALCWLWVGDLHAQEWLAYQECATAVHHLIPEVGNPLWRWVNLQGLATLPSYEVTLGKGDDLVEAVRQALERTERDG